MADVSPTNLVRRLQRLLNHIQKWIGCGLSAIYRGLNKINTRSHRKIKITSICTLAAKASRILFVSFVYYQIFQCNKSLHFVLRCFCCEFSTQLGGVILYRFPLSFLMFHFFCISRIIEIMNPNM